MEEVAQVEKVEMAAPMEDRSARVNEGGELEEVKAVAMEEAKVGVRATEVGVTVADSVPDLADSREGRLAEAVTEEAALVAVATVAG